MGGRWERDDRDIYEREREGGESAIERQIERGRDREIGG